MRETHRLRASHPGQAVRLRQRRQGGRLQDHHRRRRRGCAFAGDGGRAHGASGVRRPRRIQGADRRRFAALHRADARGRSGRDARDRQARCHQRRIAGGERARAERSGAGGPACGLAQTADRRCHRASGGICVTASNQVKLKPGDTIGILGGGQLGRMLAMAAARLGLRCQVFSPDPESPAFDVVMNATCAEYADVEALELFAADVDVITYEFENVPAAAAMILAARRPVLPERQILETTQDRLAEKDFVKRLGIGTADYADVSSVVCLRAAIARIGLPAVIKTRRFGYDGKGQAIIRDGDDPDQVWEELGTRSAILEAFIPFEREVSMIAARSADGHVGCFDVTENEHRDHILKISRAPAAISDALAAEARAIAERIAREPDYVGCLAVEMFVVEGPSGPTLLVNEIAPRVHNSGHWTLDGASVSQFEQHIRAIAGWPLGKPVRHGEVTMTNLIGDEINRYEQWLTVPGATVHLYGKGPPRPGRKMGHVTQVGAEVGAGAGPPKAG